MDLGEIINISKNGATQEIVIMGKNPLHPAFYFQLIPLNHKIKFKFR